MKYADLNAAEKEARTAAKIALAALGKQMLPDLCITLRAALNGSSDPIRYGEIQVALGALKTVDDLWLDSSLAWEAPMDNAVRELVRATVAYVEGCSFPEGISAWDVAVPLAHKEG